MNPRFSIAAVCLLLGLSLHCSVLAADSLPASEPNAVLLKSFKEPSLRHRSPSQPAKEVRLLALRTFHAPVSVRAYLTPEGPRLRVARLSGKAGYDDGTLEFQNDFPLSAAHWAHIVEVSTPQHVRDPLAGVTREQLDALETTDGSTWILEVREGDRFFYAEVRNPPFLVALKQKGEAPAGVAVPDVTDFVVCCRYLLRFAPMDEDQIY